MNGILSAAPFACDRRGEKQQCPTMLAVKRLDLGSITAVGLHVSSSMVRQSSR